MKMFFSWFLEKNLEIYDDFLFSTNKYCWCVITDYIFSDTCPVCPSVPMTELSANLGLNPLTTNDGNHNEETNHSLKGFYIHSNLFLDKASQVLMKFFITTVISEQYHEKFVYRLGHV